VASRRRFGSSRCDSVESVPAARWIRSTDGSSVVNVDHVVSFVVEKDPDRGESGQAFRIVAITVLGTAVAIAVGLESGARAQAWIDDYVTSMTMTTGLG
jgi:hypothetical protein